MNGPTARLCALSIEPAISHAPGSEARTGLLLSALPLGFGLTALFGDTMLPRAWGGRQRGFTGALLTCAVMVASIFMPVTVRTVVPLLALAGLGLGIFVPHSCAAGGFPWAAEVTYANGATEKVSATSPCP